MKRTLSILLVASVMAVFCFGISMAQGGDKVSPGGIVGSGGHSTGGGMIFTGSLPGYTTGFSSGGSFAASGGILPGMASSLSAVYAGDVEQQIAIASRTLKVAYSGGTGDAIGTFYYRPGGAYAFQEAAMSANLGGGDTLVYNLPSSGLTIRGLEYYFKIERGGLTTYEGNSLSPYIFVTSCTNAQGQRPAAMPDAKYRIVGVPIEPASNSVENVFPDDLGTADSRYWRLFSYDAIGGTTNEYPNAALVAPGQGYWLIARGGRKYGTAGLSVRPNVEYDGQDYYEVPLAEGWNQLANPFGFKIDWDDVIFDNEGVITLDHTVVLTEDVAHWYDGDGYVTASTIDAWEGVFIPVSKDGVTALLPYQESVSKSPKMYIDNTGPDNWSIQISLKSQESYDNGNMIGVRKDAMLGADSYDLLKPPPAPGAPRLAFQLPTTGEVEGKIWLRRADYRPPFEDGATWSLEIADTPDRSLEFTGIDNLPFGMEVVLLLDIGTTFSLAEGTVIKLPDETESARVIIGSKEYVDEEAPLPNEYALRQNYPNPFNAGTLISYAVSEPGHVTLIVYNILGQEVSTLVHEYQDKNDYTISWDGNDIDGRPVASGIYFYRMTINNYIQSRKMLLLK